MNKLERSAMSMENQSINQENNNNKTLNSTTNDDTSNNTYQTTQQKDDITKRNQELMNKFPQPKNREKIL